MPRLDARRCVAHLASPERVGRYERADQLYKTMIGMSPELSGLISAQPAIFMLDSHPLLLQELRLQERDADGNLRTADEVWEELGGLRYCGDILYSPPRQLLNAVGLNYAILATEFSRLRRVPLPIGGQVR
ncbi:MAG: hypothetical protein IT379_30360 [Deltaproteobacteria bacterium]|nr:hypothetical protein [Deltaproteobacteria bacterium]